MSPATLTVKSAAAKAAERAAAVGTADASTATTASARPALAATGAPTLRGLRVLLAAEGSGGHVVPALEVARALIEAEASVAFLYAQRPQTEALFAALMRRIDGELTRYPVTATSASTILGRLGAWGRQADRWTARAAQAAVTWRAARRAIRRHEPSVIAAFGGGFCIPVAIAGRRAGIPVMVHEQNVALGRANALARRWADLFALSFAPTQEAVGPRVACRVTGLPVRPSIGRMPRDVSAAALGLDPHASTVLVLGGSQGSQPINDAVLGLLQQLDDSERQDWQFVHLAGAEAGQRVAEGYRRAGVRHWVGTHLADMATAYAVADLAVSRAGASTVAELAQAGLPSILVPYPFAHGHQRANAALAERAGGAIRIEDSAVTPTVLLAHVRALLGNAERRAVMGTAFQTLARPDATTQLVRAVAELAASHHTNDGGA
jgi:UDP-N-acetylglucosamine--N-acetylmuramyl-(pentapeptide) pyrophosphoryl-undecaprenol N-acetylglucosamine transferase